MLNQKKCRLGTLSYLLPAIPIGLIIAYFLFCAVAAVIGEGWLAFYGAIILLVGLTFLTPLCGIAGLVCSFLDLRKHGVQARRITAVILNGLLLAVSVPLILSFISNA